MLGLTKDERKECQRIAELALDVLDEAIHENIEFKMNVSENEVDYAKEEAKQELIMDVIYSLIKKQLGK
jgi:hypothetical protein